MRPSEYGPAARRAFWVAIVLGVLSVLSIFVAPFFGLLQTALFVAIAWGIRRGNAWAAITGICFLVVPMIVAAMRFTSLNRPTFAFSIALLLVAVYFFAAAAKRLWSTRSAAFPWAIVMIAMVACVTCFRPFVIPTGAMESTLLPGDRIFVETVGARLGRAPRFGDIVAVVYPVDRKQTFVKRIVGLPGDRIRIENKRLFRNGAPVDEPYAQHATDYTDLYRDNFPRGPNVPLYPPALAMLKENVRAGELIVPPGKYFVLGDNRDSSLDSRYWGFISRDDIIGRPVLIYDSFNTGEKTAVASILNARWNRILKRL